MIEQNKLHQLPKGWVWTRLGEIGENVPLTGKKLKQREYQEKGRLPVIDQGQSFIGGYTDTEDLKVCCKLPIIIFGDHTKVVKYIDFDFVAGADGVKVIKPQKCFYPKLLYYFIQAVELPDKGYARHFQFLAKSFIPLPPLPEQHRIVAKIEELWTRLSAGVEALKKVKAQIKRYRQAVLKYAFCGKLTQEWRKTHKETLEPASLLLERIKEERKKKAKGKYGELPAIDTSNLPELPEGWAWTRVGEVCLIISGQTPKGIKDCEKGEIPFYKVSDMNRSGNELFMSESEIFLSEDEVKKLRIHIRDKGTIVFPKRGGAIATNKKRILTRPSTYDLNIMGVYPLIMPNKYFYYWISAIDLITLSDGSNVPQINHSDIEPLTLPLPSLPEQHCIVAEIDRRFSIADEIEKVVDQSLKQAGRLRQSILKKAYEGRLVPQDPNDEPAEKLLERIKQESKKRL